MKKANIHHQRNHDLRKSLIFNDFYEILCYFRQPFFKFGNKTAQQITNLPIFLSFFVMFLGVLQISLDTQNSSIFKNYPLFINLTNKKISQKFETLYLQFEEIHKTVASPKEKDQYLKTHLSGETPVPTIFHQIQNLKQKQKTINLYKTFEQIGPILLSEIKKGTEKQKIIRPPVRPTVPPLARPRRGQDEAIIHLGVDIPYQSWSSNTKNFNVTEDKLLTNWRFKDSDLIIQNLKKADEIPGKTHNIIQEFIVQYNNYIKEIENKKYISLKTGSAGGLPKKIQIHQNKIFIKLVRALDGRAKAGALFREPMGNNYLKIGFWLDKAQLCTPLNLIHPISKNNRFATIRSPSTPWTQLRYKKGNPQIFKNFGDPLSQILKEAVFVGLPQISPAKESLGQEVQPSAGPLNPFEKRLPTANLSARMDLALADIFYQIQEIEDQIPIKIQGSQGSEWYPFGFAEGEAESGPRFASVHELGRRDNISDPIRPLGLDDHLSGEDPVQEYEVLTYTQKVWDTLHEKLSNLQVQMPPFMEFVAQHQTGPLAKRSLLNIRLKPNFGCRRQAQTEFPNLLKFFKKIGIFLKNSKKFEKCQLKELKYIGQFDIEMTERANNQNHQKRSYYFKIRSKDKTQKNKKNQINTRSFFENIWFLPKPGSYRGVRLWAWQNGGSFRVFSHNSVSPSGLKPRFRQTVPSLKKGNQKTIQTTFDNYLQKSSHLLQRQDENPYLYFDQVISPEDYLLEALFFFIKQNLIPAKETFPLGEAPVASHSELFGEEDDRTTAGDLRSQLGHPASKRKKNLTGASPLLSGSSISKILNYLNKRKKQRDFFLKNSGQILQIKNLLDKKRKIQISVLYDSILNNYLLDPRIIERQQNFVKKTSYGGPELKILKWLKPSLVKDHIKNWALAELKDNIFWVNFQKLCPRSHFLPLTGPPKGASTQNHPILFPLYKFKEDLKFQWLWFQVQRFGIAKRWSFDEDQNGNLLDKRAAFGPGQPSVASDWVGGEAANNPNYWIHFIQSHNGALATQVGPCLCMGKYYFIRKLPQIPQKVDHPIMTIKKTNLFKKKSYLYRIINLPIITPLKKKKIKYGKDILSNLGPAVGPETQLTSTSAKFDILNLQNQFIHFYDRFFSIGDILPSEDRIAFKVLGPLLRTGSAKTGYHSNTRSVNIFQNKKFQTTDILKDLDKGLLRGPTPSGRIHPIQKSLGQKQPLYPNPKGPRQMSGYIFPDLERKQLSNWLAAKDPKNIELEIPISNINMDDFRKQLTELPIQWLAQTGARRSSLPTPFQTFQHQQKISHGSAERTWDHPFFEFRENWNNYSWSILFFLSSGWLFINLFKNLYKKYAKELVESGIDFLKRAGILDDVQWIKEELGMAPIDKGYRGIRHPGIQRKKFKNIIGLEHKHIISQVSEMVWFLKTKKLMKSTAIDPFIQVILFLSRHYDLLITKTIQTRLMKNWLPQSPAPSYQLRVLEISPSYVIIQENLRILFPESKTYQSVEISPQQKETLRPFRFRLEKIKIETPETPPKIKTEALPLALKNRNPIKPKGFLLTGPPGTGKTLLVQAIAGETSVPVVTQSGGLLQNPRLRGKGARTLHKLFLRAREIAPCIIFIDEIDGIGTRRQFLPSYIDIYGRYDPIEWLEEGSFAPPKMDPTQLPLQRRAEFLDDHDPYWEEPEFTQMVQSARIPIDVLQDLQFSRGARSEQLIMLTQLLIELDGLHSLENILVIGATNRLEILDPALMRPGRFQRILRFHLPNYHTRINLLKLYTHASKIGIENISWDYFSKRTYGLSSADIASIVFASELTAIQQSKTHTFETLERGIDLITSFPSDPVMFRLKNIFIFLENSIHEFFSKNGFYSQIWVRVAPSDSANSQTVTSAQIGSWDSFGPGQPSQGATRTQKTRPDDFISMARMQETSNIYRNCYYNIGKLVVLFCLQIMMPFSSAYIRLWIRPKNFRFFFFNKNYEFDEFDQKMFSRKEIEKRLFAFFGGKAAESLFIFLPLHPFSSETYFHFDPTFLSINNSLEQSNFGMDSEIQAAQSLLKLMVEKWYFYLERIATEKFHPILENANLWEYSEKEILLNKALVDEIIIDLDMRNRLSKNEQKYSYQTWWMKKVATQLNYRAWSAKLTLHWSRIYLSDPEDSAQNIEWVAPDEYFHTILRTRPYCMAWTHFLENGRFAISNLLLLQSFNTVFKTLRSFSEFMDFLADYFLRYECIRENEFQTKMDQFFRYLLYEMTTRDGPQGPRSGPNRI